MTPKRTERKASAHFGVCLGRRERGFLSTGQDTRPKWVVARRGHGGAFSLLSPPWTADFLDLDPTSENALVNQPMRIHLG